MIAVTSCVSASARPHIARQHVSASATIVCNDRGCASSPAASASPRVGETQRVVRVSHGSIRAYTRTYVRRHEIETEPRRAQVEQPSWSHHAVEQHAIEQPRHHGGGVVTIQTAANPITVSSSIAG
jgi:hypothetical protein